MKTTVTILAMFLLSLTLYAQEIKVSITDLLVFKNDENTSLEYAFARIHKVRTDSDNNIYVQEYKQGPMGNVALIQMFSPEGKFIRTLGAKGEGPGDFNLIGDFIPIENGKLLIADDYLRRVTVYDSRSNKFEVLANSVSSFPSHAGYYLLSKGKLLIEYNNGYSKLKNLLYIKSFDLKNNYYDFGYPSVFINEDDPLIDDKVSYANLPLSVCVVNENKIAAAPSFYDGQLTMFTLENGDWKPKRFSGFKPKLNSFEKISPDDFKNGKLQDRAYVGAGMTTSKGYAYLQHQSSRNIFTFMNKYLLHFIHLSEKPQTSFYQLDVFDLEGNYKGYKVLFTKTSADPKMKSFSVLWKDKDENFYIVEYNNKVPILKKVKMNISF